jgi:CheY-like chemotaxis protein
MLSSAMAVFGRFIPEVLDRFGSMLTDEDCLSIVGYERAGSLFLDISRHRKEFPPVEPVAGFGRYLAITEAISSYPSYTFLESLRDVGAHFAVDRDGQPPAYLSFRFAASPDRAQRSGSDPGTTKRILAIDDHEVILDLVSAMGQSMGFRVDTASSGEAGIKMCQTESYDIVLTDLAMPDLSGLEVAESVHRMNPDIPIVLITGWDAKIDRSRLSELGIREVLHKPFRIEQLTELIESLARPSV